MDVNEFKGFGFSGYRSIDEHAVKIGPLKKINFIIGQNNTGKSNIVNFLAQHYGYCLDKVKKGRGYQSSLAQDKSTFGELDKTLGSRNEGVSVAFALDEKGLNHFVHQIIDSGTDAFQRDIAATQITKLLSWFRVNSGLYWFEYHAANAKSEFNLAYNQKELAAKLTRQEWFSLWARLTRQSGGDFQAHWFPQVMTKLAFSPASVPEIEVIPAIRRIGDAGSTSEDYSGTGIIDRLARLQNPAHNELYKLQKFNKINQFLKTVLDNPTATITIPYQRDTIQVQIDGRILPLMSLGTGIHEVIILASAATILDNTIVCIEEPELHLHPLLQKKLVQYLAKNTTNKYILTTHSAHLLDAVEAEIFHVTQSNGVTCVEAVASTRSRSDICQDLGYRASDILQANCVIWVEGPSDRIYLNYWLASLNTGLIEGIHYSIMFYGGRLFSHLTALDNDDEQVIDFISIRKLNRNAVIMFDRDTSSAKASLTETKMRLRDEFDSGPGFAWITKGREIENYLIPSQVQECINKIHPTATLSSDTGIYSNLLNYNNKKKEIVTANKVKVAREYVKHYPADLSVLDLALMIEKLRVFIVACN